MTWGDESTETIKIGDTGKLFIDDVEIKQVSFSICEDTPPTSANADTMLDWLQTQGVRIILMWCQIWRFGSTTSQSALADQVAFWFPKLYARKIFVIFCPHVDKGEIDNDPEVAIGEFKPLWKARLDLPEALAGDYAEDMIFAVALTTEYDTKFSSTELETFLSDVQPECKTYLQASAIGDVPLFNVWCGWGFASDPEDPSYERAMKTVKLMKYSDLVVCDHYVQTTDSDLPDIFESGTWRYIQYGQMTQHAQAGKTGFSLWMAGHNTCGSTANEGKFDEYPVGLLQHLVSVTDVEVTISIFFNLACLDSPNTWGFSDHYCFDMDDGAPRPNLEVLAPYFPASTPPPTPPPSQGVFPTSKLVILVN